jgi:hypothetical protein
VRLLESALAKDPHSRPQSASTFAEALREVAAQEGWTVAVAPPRKLDAPSAKASPAPSEDQAQQPSARRFRRRNRRGVSPPSAGDRNVVVPEGTRRGRMDRPPRKS